MEPDTQHADNTDRKMDAKEVSTNVGASPGELGLLLKKTRVTDLIRYMFKRMKLSQRTGYIIASDVSFTEAAGAIDVAMKGKGYGHGVPYDLQTGNNSLTMVILWGDWPEAEMNRIVKEVTLNADSRRQAHAGKGKNRDKKNVAVADSSGATKIDG